MRHVISILVENRFGVLAKIAGLFSGRGFNIDSLCVGETMDPTVSRMTVVARGDDQVLQQINRQLNRLVEVIKVQDFTELAHVDRELILVKVSADPKTRGPVIEIGEIFRAKICDVSPDSLTLEITGGPGKLEALLDLLRPFEILELVRTGRVAIARGSQPLKSIED